MRATVFIVALAAFLPAQALAWNAAGHRLIGSIAWEHMSNAARTESSQLLQAHPEFERWRKRAKVSGVDDPDADRAVFIEASTWADDIRNDKRFYDADRETPTTTLPGFPDMERRRHWHYVNRPFDGSSRQKPMSGQLETQLPVLIDLLEEEKSTRASRIYALPWLLHLVGDAHQPLHTLTRRMEKGIWDAGGNRVRIVNPFNSRYPETTLHTFWDDLPGPPWLRGEQLDKASRAMMVIYPRPPRSVSARGWIEESWQMARQHAYPKELDEHLPEEAAAIVIDAAFFENSREVANRRIAEAGYRLADVLNRVFRSSKPYRR
ncbi:S1/P1 nuclease [Propionivibrio limicola]|uniref:S1/P1 nuclease n=1 Tax=Propionivibrio limicola TaxID=167645 RepID=UPI0012912DF3|nr:S1/P1 nuclease [Propionivibrio limicola]